VITSKKEPAAPEFIVATDNWILEPSLPPDTFAFSPPKGAVEINFVKGGGDRRYAPSYNGTTLVYQPM
jgi:hypothetical protein